MSDLDNKVEQEANKIISQIQPVVDKFVDQLLDQLFQSLEDILDKKNTDKE